MEEKTYVGYAYGTFAGDDGQQHDYCNVFMLEDFSGDESDTRHYGGQQAIKYKCDSPEVFAKVTPGSKVRCYYDSRGKLAYMQAVNGGKD